MPHQQQLPCGKIITVRGAKVRRNFRNPTPSPCARGGSRLHLNGGDEVPEVQDGLV